MDRFNNEGYFYTEPYVPWAGEEPLSQYDSIPVPAQQQSWDNAPPTAVADSWNPDEELAAMLSPAPAPAPQPFPDPLGGPLGRSDRRRMQKKPHFLAGRRITQATILISAICVCAALLLGWSVAYTYEQLRTVAESMLPDTVARWWPLAVYGPWFVAALSILRATVQHRCARRSWAVLLAASAMAAALCVGYSSRSLMAFVMFGIPPLTALVCFWELIGQVSSKRSTRQGAHAQRSPRT
ncbi:DUF2637 domain-containing protein [Streptomyces sp. NPDC058644]|uniref:DUF2637 domain-containing protein n=1 Tax=unclassified Streptomyces TaxID=2593676 RepID=UPI0036688382